MANPTYVAAMTYESGNDTLTIQHEAQFFLSAYFIVCIVLMILWTKQKLCGSFYIKTLETLVIVATDTYQLLAAWTIHKEIS